MPRIPEDLRLLLLLVPLAVRLWDVWKDRH